MPGGCYREDDGYGQVRHLVKDLADRQAADDESSDVVEDVLICNSPCRTPNRAFESTNQFPKSTCP